MAYAFVRVEKFHSVSELNKYHAHVYRTEETLNAIGNPELNKTYIGDEKELFGRTFNEKVRKLQDDGLMTKKIRKNSVYALDVVMGYSKEDSEGEFKINDVDAWVKDSIDWLKKKFDPEGKGNVISVVLHNDENCGPHLHAVVIPINKDNNLSANSFIAHKKDMVDIQSTYAQAVSKYGLKRGLHKSIAKHESIQKFYTKINEKVMASLPIPKKGENLKDYYKRANEIYKQEVMRAFQQEKKHEREIIEAKTINIQTRLDMKKVKREYDKKIKALNKISEKINDIAIEDNKVVENVLKDLENYNLLMKGLKNYEDKKTVEKTIKNIQKIVAWQRTEEKEREKEWENLWNYEDETFANDTGEMNNNDDNKNENNDALKLLEEIKKKQKKKSIYTDLKIDESDINK